MLHYKTLNTWIKEDPISSTNILIKKLAAAEIIRIQNRANKVAIAVDIDHDNVFIWEEKGLPAPTIQVINKSNRKSLRNKTDYKQWQSHLFNTVDTVLPTDGHPTVA